jgi:hypothetical protein
VYDKSSRLTDVNLIIEIIPTKMNSGSFKAMMQLKGQPDIGDQINKIIGELAKAIGLTGVITVADFNDDAGKKLKRASGHRSNAFHEDFRRVSNPLTIRTTRELEVTVHHEHWGLNQGERWWRRQCS